MGIDYEKVSGALYIKLHGGKYNCSECSSEKADVYLDMDAKDSVLGL